MNACLFPSAEEGANDRVVVAVVAVADEVVTLVVGRVVTEAAELIVVV